MRFYITGLFGVILACASTASAADAKPVVCSDYTIATTRDGGTLGVCAPSKAGGKGRYLRSFVETKVLNPATGKPQTVLVGYP